MTDDRSVVGFDATALEMPRPTGVGRYTRELLRALVARNDPWRYTLLASRKLPREVLPGTTGQSGARLPNRWLWMQLVLPSILRRLQPRLCHFTNSLAPIFCPTPYVVTVHDMSLFLHANTHGQKRLLLMRSILPRVVAHAAAIVVPSESAKHDLVEVLGISDARVHVTHEAAAPNYRVITNVAMLDDVRRRYALESPFILAVGTLEPRKNLDRLVRAFAILVHEGRRETLVLAGEASRTAPVLMRRITQLGLEGRVRILGYVPDDDLPALYNLAKIAAFPSIYEGFGLPILEGMACGVAVLTSRRSSMQELADDAAWLADPMDVDDIANGLRTLLSDEGLRADFCARGLSRAAEYSWSEVARRTVAIYDSIRSRDS